MNLVDTHVRIPTIKNLYLIDDHATEGSGTLHGLADELSECQDRLLVAHRS